MKTFQLLSTRTILLATLFGTLLFAACGDNPAGGDDEHADPHGMELVHDGEVIFEYTEDDGLNEHTHMHFHVGEEYPFEVHFLDEDGEHVHEEDLGDEYSLGWVIEDEKVMDIIQHEEEDGKWNFHLIAVGEGESRVQFILKHGSHSDLSTPETKQENAIEFHIDAQGDENPDH